jgi:hypothetical protein
MLKRKLLYNLVYAREPVQSPPMVGQPASVWSLTDWRVHRIGRLDKIFPATAWLMRNVFMTRELTIMACQSEIDERDS